MTSPWSHGGAVAEQGEPRGQLNIARMYDEGRGGFPQPKALQSQRQRAGQHPRMECSSQFHSLLIASCFPPT